MAAEINTFEHYIESLPEDRQQIVIKLQNTFLENLPDGFEPMIQYNMPSFVIPHKLYPAGYHCSPEQPLPFISFASRSNYIALYHMGIYAIAELYAWFVEEYPKHVKAKLDMGKSCIKFKKPEHIPYGLIAELAQKITPQKWIEVYENNLKK